MFFKGLQNDRPKWRGVYADPRWTTVCKTVSKTILIWSEKRGCLSSQTVTWLFLWVGYAFTPHLKEDIQGYLLMWNQDHCPTDRYFMIIFWCPPGVCKHPSLFCLSLCNLLAHIRLPYVRWKGTSIALMWCILACSTPSIYRDMKAGYELVNRPS